MDMQKRWCDLSVKEYIEMERGPLWAISWGQSLLQAGIIALLGWLFLRWKRRKVPKLHTYDVASHYPAWCYSNASACRNCGLACNGVSASESKCPGCGFDGRPL